MHDMERHIRMVNDAVMCKLRGHEHQAPQRLAHGRRWYLTMIGPSAPGREFAAVVGLDHEARRIVKIINGN